MASKAKASTAPKTLGVSDLEQIQLLVALKQANDDMVAKMSTVPPSEVSLMLGKKLMSAPEEDGLAKRFHKHVQDFFVKESAACAKAIEAYGVDPYR